MYSCMECRLHFYTLDHIQLHKATVHNCHLADKCKPSRLGDKFTITDPVINLKDSSNCEEKVENTEPEIIFHKIVRSVTFRNGTVDSHNGRESCREELSCTVLSDNDLETILHQSDTGQGLQSISFTNDQKLNEKILTSNTLDDHLLANKKAHPGEKRFRCDICDAEFAYKSGLSIHKRKHTGEKPYRCDVCGVGFTQSNYLHRHERTHTGEKPFKCDICGVGFSVSYHLQRHVRIHTGEKPYKCDTCDKTFTDSSCLSMHKRKHTGEKPYKCDVCGVGFAQSNSLHKHKRRHTGEKPYKCDVCGAEFSVTSSLSVHKKKHIGKH